MNIQNNLSVCLGYGDIVCQTTLGKISLVAFLLVGLVSNSHRLENINIPLDNFQNRHPILTLISKCKRLTLIR